jgi:hypothetical protein
MSIGIASTGASERTSSASTGVGGTITPIGGDGPYSVSCFCLLLQKTPLSFSNCFITAPSFRNSS